jgi:hypothetical protein
MGIDPAILRSKLNPNCDTNHLTLKQAVAMQVITGRSDILHAMAEELGHVALPLPCITSVDLPRAIAKTCGEFGDYLRRVDECMSDGQVTPNEIKSLERELTELMAAAGTLQAMLAGKR